MRLKENEAFMVRKQPALPVFLFCHHLGNLYLHEIMRKTEDIDIYMYGARIQYTWNWNIA